MSEAPALLETRNLVKHFRLPGGWLFGDRQYVRAVDDVSLQVRAGEVLGVVGESGSGKTTLGRLLLRLEEPTQGSIAFRGEDLAKVGRQSMRNLRREMQVVFQNPFTSLDPRMRVLDVVALVAAAAAGTLVSAVVPPTALLKVVVPLSFTVSACAPFTVPENVLPTPVIVVAAPSVTASP